MADLADQVRETLGALFRSGSRYQGEKLAVLVLYAGLTVGTVSWVIWGGEAENELGAKFGSETVEQIDQEIFFLENTSSEDWTNVNLILNRVYQYHAEEVGAGDRLSLAPDKFEYFFYVPRPWGRTPWEELADGERPGRHGPPNMKPELVQVRANEGKLDIDVDAHRNGGNAGGGATATTGATTQ